MAGFAALPAAPAAPGPEAQAVTDANTAFALDLYARLRTQPGNLFYSPFSISSALAMTSAGAAGDTLAEMAKTLHLPADQTALRRLRRPPATTAGRGGEGRLRVQPRQRPLGSAGPAVPS